MRRAFDFKSFCLSEERDFSNKFLEKCLIYFKMCGDGKKYVYIVRYCVCNIYENYM